MRTIAVISQKGGAGKTTTAVHLAVAAQQEGYRVAVIDLDPQATARKWGDKRQDPEPEVIGDHAERLPQLVEAARANGADLLIIDTAPNADRASLAAARAADLILIPCRPAAFDLEATRQPETWPPSRRNRPSLSSTPPQSAAPSRKRHGKGWKRRVPGSALTSSSFGSPMRIPSSTAGQLWNLSRTARPLKR
jgi:chromosome partitioning protein